MRTLIIVLTGFVLFGFLLAVTKYLADWSAPSKTISTYVFVVIWFFATVYNVSIGISKGYTVLQELPVFLVTFLLPVGVALFIKYKFL